MAVIVFDLDMTIIDSSHRHVSKADGSVDLDHWIENSTHEKVMQDTLLPLARAVRRFYDAGHKVVFCTARVMGAPDHAFLASHADALPHHALFSRPLGDTRKDGIIKLEQIDAYIHSLGFSNYDKANVHLFEDNLKTIEMFMARDAICYNAIRCNERMAA